MKNRLKKGIAVAGGTAVCMTVGGLLGSNVEKIDAPANYAYIEDTQHFEASPDTLTNEGIVGGGLVWLLGTVCVAGFRAGQECLAEAEQ